jgi:predicted transcriptional regulator
LSWGSLPETAEGQTVIEQTATIIAAFVKRNQVAPTELPALITQVRDALSNLGQAPIAAAELSPAVPIRRSIRPEAITCLDCGAAHKMIKRHLMTAHSLTPELYRARWGLPRDYPMVAPAYAQQRSALAKQIGLGQTNRGRRGKSK